MTIFVPLCLPDEGGPLCFYGFKINLDPLCAYPPTGGSLHLQIHRLYLLCVIDFHLFALYFQRRC